MPVAIRIIPQLLCRGSQLVKGKRFNAWRSVGIAAQAVRIHQMRGVDELVLVDIGATAGNRGPDLEMVRSLAEVCFSPLSVGGGVKSADDVRALIHNGADKVIIGAACHENPDMVKAVCDGFGSSTIVGAIDVSGGMVQVRNGTKDTGRDPVDYAKNLQEIGAGEILLTSIDREGMMEGYDLELIEKVSSAVRMPVVASGGAGNYQHMYEAIQVGASAVSAGAMFQFTSQTPRGAAEYLAQKGVEVRL